MKDEPKITHSYYDTKTGQHLPATPELDARFRHKAWESLNELFGM